MLEGPPRRKGFGDLEEGVAHVLKEARLGECASQRDGVEALEEDGGERAGLRDRDVVGTLEQPPGSLSRRLRREVRVELAHELGEGELAQDIPLLFYLREVGVEEVVVPSQGRLDAEVPHEVAVRPPDHEVTEGGDKLPPRRSDGVDLGGEPNESLAEGTTSARGRKIVPSRTSRSSCFASDGEETLGNPDTRANVLAIELLPDVTEGLEPHAALEDDHPLRDELHLVFTAEVTICVTLPRRPRRRNEAATARTLGRILCAGR
eukprot:scaffold5110_cov122-Isochrysis_galbana.AAC.4